ncbi:unnamed protein product [Dracunculus medinensis]|uniref:Uncharacterized protein n=1 Tax=Dracunculus medinensis TaxID=318479 RepID=A0A0N4UHI8_DRAME|nr:unnamed protein product [Dracunculus medinensis]
MYHTLTSILANIAKSESERMDYEKKLSNDFVSLTKVLSRNVEHINDDRNAFFFQLIQISLEVINAYLKNTSCSERFVLSVCKALSFLINGKSFVYIAVPVLKTLGSLIRSMSGFSEEKLVRAELLSLILACLKWLVVCRDDINIKEFATAFISLLSLLKKQNELTSDLIESYSKILVTSAVTDLFAKAKQELFIAHPTSHDFEFISPFVQQILLKSATLCLFVLKELSTAIASQGYGSMAQFIILLSMINLTNASRPKLSFAPNSDEQKKFKQYLDVARSSLLEQLADFPINGENSNYLKQIENLFAK